MAISKFDEIRGWQEARILTKMIYELTHDGLLAKDFGLRDQLQRAAVSTMANIAEGFDCESHAEFARFLGFARRSAVEVQSLLYAALDAATLPSPHFKPITIKPTKPKPSSAPSKPPSKSPLDILASHSAPRT